MTGDAASSASGTLSPVSPESPHAGGATVARMPSAGVPESASTTRSHTARPAADPLSSTTRSETRGWNRPLVLHECVGCD